MAGMKVKIGADTSALGAGMRRAKGMVGGLGASLKKLGGVVKGMGLAALFTGIALAAKTAADSVKTFASFEETMSKVRAVSGATGGEFKSLLENAKELGASTRFTAKQVGELQLEFSKLGFTSSEITQVTKATLALAQASGSDLARSAEVAGGTLRGFGLDASETGRVADVMAKSFSTSALDLEKYAEAMKYVAPVARASNISLEETTAMLGVLADSMVSGSQAGTSLRRIMTELAKTGKPFEQALQDLAGKKLSLTDANDEVGRTAQTTLLILSNNMEKLKGLGAQYENAGGSAAAMAAIMDDNLSGAMARLSSAWEGFKISLGESLAPVAHGLIEGLQGAVKTVNLLKSAFDAGVLPGLLKDGFLFAGKTLINFLVKGFKGVVMGLIAGFSQVPEIFSKMFAVMKSGSFWQGLFTLAASLGNKIGSAFLQLLPDKVLEWLGAGGVAKKLDAESGRQFQEGMRLVNEGGVGDYLNTLKDTGGLMAKEFAAEMDKAGPLDVSGELGRIRETVAALNETTKKAGEAMQKGSAKPSVSEENQDGEKKKGKFQIVTPRLNDQQRVGGATIKGRGFMVLDQERNVILRSIDRKVGRGGGTVARYA